MTSRSSFFSSHPHTEDTASGSARPESTGMRATTFFLLSGVAWFVAHVVVELVAHILIGLPVFGMAAPVI